MQNWRHSSTVGIVCNCKEFFNSVKERNGTCHYSNKRWPIKGKWRLYRTKTHIRETYNEIKYPKTKVKPGQGLQKQWDVDKHTIYVRLLEIGYDSEFKKLDRVLLDSGTSLICL